MPIQITLLAEVILVPARNPIAVLKLPIVLLESAPLPTAVFSLPRKVGKPAPTLLKSALTPMAVLSDP
jgi:hypothetical protein